MLYFILNIIFSMIIVVIIYKIIDFIAGIIEKALNDLTKNMYK